MKYTKLIKPKKANWNLNYLFEKRKIIKTN